MAEVIPHPALKYIKQIAGFSQPVLSGKKPSTQGSRNGSERCSESSPSCRSRSRPQKPKWRDANAGGSHLNPCIVFLFQMAGPQICKTLSDELLRAEAGPDIKRFQQLLTRDSGLTALIPSKLPTPPFIGQPALATGRWWNCWLVGAPS